MQYQIQIYSQVNKLENASEYQIIYTCYYDNIYYDTTETLVETACPFYANIYACGYAAKALKVNANKGQIFYFYEKLYYVLKGLDFDNEYKREIDRLFYYELSKTAKFSYGTLKEKWFYEYNFRPAQTTTKRENKANTGAITNYN